MALILNEEQQSLKDIAKEFLQKNAPVTHFREIRDTQNGNSRINRFAVKTGHKR